MLSDVMAEEDEDVVRRVAEKLTEDAREALLKKGFVVLDNIFGPNISENFHKELEWLFRSGHMQPNQVQFQTTTGPVNLVKPNIYESDMHDGLLSTLSGIGAFKKLFHNADELVKLFNSSLPSLGLKEGLKHRTVKLQYNQGGGGCFPWHYDNPSRPNNRGLTLLVYLNSEWKDGDGGELELCPFLEKREMIAPLMDRAVLFLSDRILHRVQPSHARRLCFTIWFDSELVNSDDDVFLKAKHLQPSAVELLKRSPLQRVLSRAVYREEYEESLLECFGRADGGGVDSQACKLSLKLHTAHLQGLMKSESVAQFVDHLRTLKPV